jgi:ABC-2 type transport system ATP-binding protein
MTMDARALELTGLSKAFGTTVAADSVDLTVPQGSFYGLVGPNGAGKTTVLSMAVGLLRPDAGSAQVLGIDVWSDPVSAKRLMGVLPDGMMLPERLTGSELLRYQGLLRGLAIETVEARARELLEVLDLADARETLVIEYSTGMRKKIGLAAALLHAPELLVLDEPFEGVDPVSATTIRTILRRFVQAGNTVIFSSHVMTLVETLCSHVAIIADGRVRAAGPMDEIRAGRSLEEVFIELVGASIGGREGLTWLAS